MKRKEFCRIGAAGALTTVTDSAWSQTVGGETIVGAGEHRYRWHSNWVQLPNNVVFEKNTHGVQVDRAGHVYVHSQSDHSVVVLDSKGNYVRSWGAEYKAGAHGLQLSREGREEFLYLTLTAPLRQCVKTTLTGEVVWKLGYPEVAVDGQGQPCYPAGEGYNPTNVAITPNGDRFWIADGYGKSFIHEYRQRNHEPEYVRTWGGVGTDVGKLRQPHGIWYGRYAGEPALFVADRANNRSQFFAPNGDTFGFSKEGMGLPCHFDQRGQLILVPQLDGKVSLVNEHGQFIVHLGENPKVEQRAKNGLPRNKWVDGAFIAPHGACFTVKGDIIVVEWVAEGGRVTYLEKIA